MSSQSLSLQTSNKSRAAITIALPQSIRAKIIKSMVEQVFVWIVQDNTSATDLIAFLQENGFKNIKVDSKGTTITAQSGSLVNNNNTSSTTSTSTPGDVTADDVCDVSTRLEEVYSCSENASPINCTGYYVLNGDQTLTACIAGSPVTDPVSEPCTFGCTTSG